MLSHALARHVERSATKKLPPKTPLGAASKDPDGAAGPMLQKGIAR